MTSRSPILMLLIGVPQLVGAQTAPAVPTNVDAVEAGGYWTTGSQEGQYRLIVESSGYEHIVSRVFLQWLSQPKSSDDSVTILASVELTEIDAGGWRLYAPRFQLHGAQWQATIDGENSHTQPVATSRWRLTLGVPGKYSMAYERPKP